jgi:Ca-activated chloride channel homolog
MGAHPCVGSLPDRTPSLSRTATVPRWLASFGFALAAVFTALLIAACERSPNANAAKPVTAGTVKPASPDEVVVLFPYGSEKRLWIEAVTSEFNQSARKTASGKTIRVEPVPMGSGEIIEETLAGRLEAHLVSPASKAFITLANARQQAKAGRPLVPDTKDLVMSPVVIAMWKPMAEALGWPDKPVGWEDVIALTREPTGWASKGFPQWGRFKFGHTHPEYSNSGLMSVIAQTYAGADKTQGLTPADLALPAVAAEMGEIQKSIVHYGESTGFFGRSMFSNGPEYLSAAVLYENVVIESYDTSKYTTPFPIVAIYPKEGTFWTENPCGVVDLPHVSPDHKDAAKKYLEYLLERPRQEAALSFGFRPADVAVPLGSPIDAAHGVNPREPKTTLETPDAAMIDGVITLWKQHKKRANIVLALDVSGSMNREDRIGNARAGALELIDLLSDDDTFSLLTFNSRPTWLLKGASVRELRAEIRATISSLTADGGTALYDAAAEAHAYLQSLDNDQSITAVVVLSDGEDRNSKRKIKDILDAVAFDPETRNIRVFMIGYGGEADQKIMEQISSATKARAFKGDTKNIRKVFKEIATFF